MSKSTNKPSNSREIKEREKELDTQKGWDIHGK